MSLWNWFVGSYDHTCMSVGLFIDRFGCVLGCVSRYLIGIHMGISQTNITHFSWGSVSYVLHNNVREILRLIFH